MSSVTKYLFCMFMCASMAGTVEASPIEARSHVRYAISLVEDPEAGAGAPCSPT
ncbi:hypothetical protein BH11MYX1_BH11MYX1_44830 [soil metagenome]